MKEKKGVFNTILRYVSPGFMLMSVMIGGGFATGREIVQYGGLYGAKGWIVGVAIAVTFSILCMVSFEIARKYKAYDYRSHLKVYAGPLSYVYDVVFFVTALIAMSVMASATGTILETTMGLPYIVGVLIIIVISAILNFFGQKLVEKVAVAGAVALYLGYILFAILAISGRGDNIARVFATGDTSYYTGNITTLGLIWVGITYVGFNIQPVTTAFFTVKDIKTRKEALISGLITGIIILIPWALTYLALMAFYPSEEVFGAGVPWLIMMMNVSPIVVVLFGIIAGWTLIATTIGIMNALTDRIDNQLAEGGKKPLSAKVRAIITLAYLGGAVLLSKVGIISLISKGYTAMSYGMIISFGIPVLTVGTYKAFFKKDDAPADEKDS